MTCAFDDLGPQNLKNIAEPVRADRAAGSTSNGKVAPPLHDKPSIAVLPFANMSGDPKQEYFSDGITEDIITELSRFRSLFVIARNSSFSYKGRSVKVQEIGRDLGVAYIVEGSVRKAGNRVRVTAQLIEAATGNHVWAEKYDREIDDIFAVQDDLVQAITTLVAGRVDGSVLDRARRKPTDSMTAYDYLLRAEWALDQPYDSADALPLLLKAIEIDPRCARAYCRLAAYYAYSIFARGTDVAEAQRLAQYYAQKALESDPEDSFVQVVVAQTNQMIGKPDLAKRHIEQAIAINPNDIYVIRYAEQIYAYLGNHGAALKWNAKYLRLDPRFPASARETLVDTYYMMRSYADVVASFEGWDNPPPHMYCELAAAHAQLGQMEQAGAAVAEFECRRPEGYTIADYCDAHTRMCARPEDAAHWLEGYRKAGLLK